MGEVKPAIETFAKIKVIGVGGSGGSSSERMIRANMKGVDFIVANTDVQALLYSHAPLKIHLGKTATRGLGAGMNPEVGRTAAEESQNEIREALKGADMVFITCGLGGGTGTGAAPVIAMIAKEIGALTVAVVTKPFSFEGAKRREIAERGYQELASRVDTIISIPNDRVLNLIDKKTSLIEAFETVDEVLLQGVQGISELITTPGLINVDFADVKSIMTDTGNALMGIGHASGENRATEAAKRAIASPLLEVSIEGANGILFTITGGANLSLHEVTEAANIITEHADPDAKVIFGAVIDDKMKDEVKVCVIATGFDGSRKMIADHLAEVSYLETSKERKVDHFGKAAFKDRSLSVEREESTVSAKNGPVIRPSSPSDSFGGQKANDRLRDEAEADREDDLRNQFSKKDIKIVEDTPPVKEKIPANGSDEPDFDIPAFLRRKMF